MSGIKGWAGRSRTAIMYNLYVSSSEMKISDARSHLAQVVREADLSDQETIITQNGRPAAVVIGFEEWRALAAARDAATWDRIRARQARTTWLDHDEVVRRFATEHDLDGPDVSQDVA